MLIFVYGTLKKGFHNHHYLDTSKFLGNHKTEPIYTMKTNGGFPIVERGGQTSITGEVYKLSDEDLSGVFLLEGYTGVQHNPRNWYDTDTIVTYFGEASIFVMAKDKNQLPIIENGVF